jgi:hypothetical protein
VEGGRAQQHCCWTNDVPQSGPSSDSRGVPIHSTSEFCVGDLRRGVEDLLSAREEAHSGSASQFANRTSGSGGLVHGYGYFFPRERECYLYLGTVSSEEAQTARAVVASNFALAPRVLDKRGKGYALYFSARQARALADVIGKHLLPYFRYKLPFDPVTTDRLLKSGTVR